MAVEKVGAIALNAGSGIDGGVGDGRGVFDGERGVIRDGS